MNYASPIIITLLGLQLAAFLLLVLLRQIFKNLSEKITISIVTSTIFFSIFLISALIFFTLHNPQHPQIIDIGTWFGIENMKYEIVFIIDALSLTYSLFAMTMISLVAIFSRRYLHKENGFHRFYIFMLLFALGANIISFAGTMEIIIIGWEFVGLSSILLIAFFNYRAGPVKNSFWVFVNYRICDIGLFAAVLVLHAFEHSSNFQMLENANWLGVSSHQAPLILGFLILFAAMGKSALFPFSNWLQRAMEGPTPSSAIFYGAISIHFGPLLLLRSADLIANMPALKISVILIGLTTALFARIISHGQSDVKSMLAYSSVAQVGLIVAEIGLGFNMLALLHIIGHSSFRTLQMLRAPSIIHDLRNIEQLLGHSLLPINLQKKHGKFDYFIYRFILERGYMDNILQKIIGLFLKPFYAIDRLEKKWSNFLSR